MQTLALAAILSAHYFNKLVDDTSYACRTLVVGDTAQAAQYLRRALAIQTAALGPRHPHVGTVLHNLGRILHDEKEVLLSVL